MAQLARLPQLAAHFDAVHEGHLNIGDNEVRHTFACHRQSLLAVGSITHVVMLTEHKSHETRHVDVVLDNEHNGQILCA